MGCQNSFLNCNDSKAFISNPCNSQTSLAKEINVEKIDQDLFKEWLWDNIQQEILMQS